MAKALAIWIAKNLGPISIVDDDGLIDVLKIATANSDYQPPGRKAITTKLHDLYKLKVEDIKGIFAKEANTCSKLSLALDYWTSSTSNNSYLGVIVFMIDDSWVYRNFTIGIDQIDERLTADNIKEQVLGLLQTWDIELSRISFICTDNAANMVKSIEMIGKVRMPCMAHTMQLSIKHALEQANASSLFTKCRKIVGHFKHSPIQENNLEAKILAKSGKTKARGLIQDVPTRWGSTLLMVSYFLFVIYAFKTGFYHLDQ